MLPQIRCIHIPISVSLFFVCRYENKGDLDAAINCFARSVDIEIVQAGCIPDNPVDLVSKLSVLSAAGSATGFDLVGSFITLSKLLVLKKAWQPAADFCGSAF